MQMNDGKKCSLPASSGQALGDIQPIYIFSNKAFP